MNYLFMWFQVVGFVRFYCSDWFLITFKIYLFVQRLLKKLHWDNKGVQVKMSRSLEIVRKTKTNDSFPYKHSSKNVHLKSLKKKIFFNISKTAFNNSIFKL